MDPFITGGIIQGVGSLFSSIFNRNSAAATNRMNLKLQQQQQAWQEKMANSEIQRRAADIEAAGGNRALAFVNGSGASTPNVAPARMEAPVFNDPQLGTALMMAQSIKKMKAETDLTTEQQDVARATAANIRQQTITGANTATNLAQQTKNLEQAIENMRADLAGKLTANEIAAIQKGIQDKTAPEQIAIIEANLRKARAEATSAEKRALFDEALTNFVKMVERTATQYFKREPKPVPPPRNTPLHKGRSTDRNRDRYTDQYTERY